jgi:hypothetical protein
VRDAKLNTKTVFLPRMTATFVVCTTERASSAILYINYGARPGKGNGPVFFGQESSERKMDKDQAGSDSGDESSLIKSGNDNPVS